MAELVFRDIRQRKRKKNGQAVQRIENEIAHETIDDEARRKATEGVRQKD